MLMAGVVALALAAPASAKMHEAKKLSWGNIKAWVKKKIEPVLEHVKDPKVKEALGDLSKTLDDLKGKLKGLYPQFKALTGYLAVAAAKTKEGAKLDDLLPLIEKIKEATGKIGEGGIRAVREWIKANQGKFKGAAKVFQTALKRGWMEFKNKALAWWKKAKAKAKAVLVRRDESEVDLAGWKKAKAKAKAAVKKAMEEKASEGEKKPAEAGEKKAE
jgi:hypothetical protein